jgi:hypothetical protein
MRQVTGVVSKLKNAKAPAPSHSLSDKATIKGNSVRSKLSKTPLKVTPMMRINEPKTAITKQLGTFREKRFAHERRNKITGVR